MGVVVGADKPHGAMAIRDSSCGACDNKPHVGGASADTVPLSPLSGGGDQGKQHAMRKAMLVPRTAVVWCPIPLITWVFPFVGHVGLAYANGATSEFAGDFTVLDNAVGTLMFGRQARYCAVARPNDVPAASWDELVTAWDQQIGKTAVVFSQENYSFITNNSHAMVCHALNAFQRQTGVGLERAAVRDWNVVRLAAHVFFYGRHISVYHAARTWLPWSAFVVTCTLWLGPSRFFTGYAAASAFAIAGFVLVDMRRTREPQ